MKLPRLLLLGSLALNVVLLGWLVRRAPANAAVAAGGLPETNGHLTRSTGGSGAAPATSMSYWLGLDAAAMQQKLQPLNLPPEVVESLVISRIFARYNERRRELSTAAMKFPWWQTVTAWPARLALLTPAQQKELRELEAAARNEVLQRLGPGALDRDGTIATRYSFVPAKRAVLLGALLRDYEDIKAELKDETRGIRTAADREKEKFLEAERQRDIAALLSPAERDIFEHRTASAAAVMQNRLGVFEPTEAEYRAVFAIFREFEADHPGVMALQAWGQRLGASENGEYEEKIHQILGDARYADWMLSGQGYAQSLSRLAPQLNLSPATVKGVAVLLDNTLKRSREIGGDGAMEVPQKLSALANLAAQARSEVTARLGPTGAGALLSQLSWLDLIAQGNAVTVTGHATSWSPVNRVPPGRRPAPNVQTPRQ
ncbi:MAG: hypothetical protein HY736_18610 [Verrucomicrobia bacterium]|nr:hypothetical protein [Verrucomicrobiota bacterium]